MKRSDAVIEISKKLQKQEHMFTTYAKDGKISFKQLCDNLAMRVLTQAEELGMSPPNRKAKPEDLSNDLDQDFLDTHEIKISEWEKED